MSRAARIWGLWAPGLALCLVPSAVSAQATGSSPDSSWAALRPPVQVSLFRQLYPAPDPEPDVLRWHPLLRRRGPERPAPFVGGLMASALSRAACGPNRVCRFYLQDAYQREYGLIPRRAGWLGELLGRALVPELERLGVSLGSSWWPETLTQTDP